MAPLFILTPATLAWSPLFAGYYTYLGFQVGITGQAAFQAGVKDIFNVGGREIRADDSAEVKAKKVAVGSAARAHGNFGEWVPLTLLLVALAELNGAPTWSVHTTLATLLAFRVVHAQFGILKPGKGRIVGFLGTAFVLVGTSLYNFGLSADFIWTEIQRLF